MGATAFIIVGSHPHITYGLPNPGYVLILHENNAPAWELIPLYPETQKELGTESILWISTIDGMLEDALLMIGVYVVRDKQLVSLARKTFGKGMKNKVELIRFRELLPEFRKLARESLQRYDIGLVIVPLEDSTIMGQLNVLKEYGDLWVSINPPLEVIEEDRGMGLIWRENV